MALTYFDLYADAYRRGVMTEGQLVTAVKIGRITLPQAIEIRDTGGKCGALWTPPAPEPTPTTPTPEAPAPTPETPPQGGTDGTSGTSTAPEETTPAETTSGEAGATSS